MLSISQCEYAVEILLHEFCQQMRWVILQYGGLQTVVLNSLPALHLYIVATNSYCSRLHTALQINFTIKLTFRSLLLWCFSIGFMTIAIKSCKLKCIYVRGQNLFGDELHIAKHAAQCMHCIYIHRYTVVYSLWCNVIVVDKVTSHATVQPC